MTAGLTEGRQTQCRRNEVECRSVQERHEVSEQYRDRRKGVNTINRTGQNQNPSAEQDRTRWMATSVSELGFFSLLTDVVGVY